MKNFMQKNRGYIIAALMLFGILILGLGLDWDQSQIPWRGNISPLPIALGSVMFVVSIIWLAAGSSGREKGD